VLVYVYPFALALVLWDVLSRFDVLGNDFVFPSPQRVYEQARVVAESGELRRQTTTTVREVVTAYGLALVAGVIVGTAIGRIRVVEHLLRPVASFLFPTPKIALYPAMVIVFGLGSASKVAFGFAEAVFPILLATAAATSQVEPRLLWSASALGTPPHRSFTKVVIPAALPGILTGARIGLIGALIGVFLGEMIAGGGGLGQMMAASYRRLETSNMYVAILTVSLIGFALDRTFLLLRGRLLAWSPEEGY
jgi:NitT/TauT family transport system permease protein